MKKIISNLIILFCVFVVVIGIIACIYSMYYYNININIQLVIKIFVAMVLMFVILYIPFKIGRDRERLVEENFILDIYVKNNNKEHIRITEKNIMFKYESVIRYWYIYPKFFSFLSLNSELGKTPTYIIKNKIQLQKSEVNSIIEKLNELSNTTENQIIINIKGNKKYINANKINGIFEKYNIEI